MSKPLDRIPKWRMTQQNQLRIALQYCNSAFDSGACLGVVARHLQVAERQIQDAYCMGAEIVAVAEKQIAEQVAQHAVLQMPAAD